MVYMELYKEDFKQFLLKLVLDINQIWQKWHVQLYVPSVSIDNLPGKPALSYWEIQ